MPSSFPECAELLTSSQVGGDMPSQSTNSMEWAHEGMAPPPLKIGKGTVRYSRAAYVEWIAGGCKPSGWRAAR